MKKKKLLVIIGTRPEAIKLAPIVLEARARPEEFDVWVCLTGQHRKMLEQVVNLFEISPQFNLDVMAPGQNLHDLTRKILHGLQPVLQKVCPDFVAVQGDTTSALIGGLSGYYEKIPVCHVEAGLRTGDIMNPWPEEGNRRLLGAIASMHFAPTETCRTNLLGEGIPERRIIVTGNTVIDALGLMCKRLEQDSELRRSQIDLIEKAGFPWRRTVSDNSRILLITGHRRESFGEGFRGICEGIHEIAKANPNIAIVYPVHLNPNVQEPVRELLSSISNVFLLDPLSYLPFIMLMKRAYLILTDSGGIQEEAPTLGKPILVMRDTTERPEGVNSGTSLLVGTKPYSIFEQTQRLLNDPESYASMAQAQNPYGDGNASKRCLDALTRFTS